MYARLATIPVAGIDRSRAESLAGEATAVFETLPGYQSATFLLNDDSTELAALSVWESREHAESASDAMRTWVLKSLDGNLTGQPTTKVYEVYEK
jgi:heme-degrading monooxygenase HmoA